MTTVKQLARCLSRDEQTVLDYVNRQREDKNSAAIIRSVRADAIDDTSAMIIILGICLDWSLGWAIRFYKDHNRNKNKMAK